MEFIQIRGFLVDMRHAENRESEKAAFEKLMDFVEQAKDKELWIKFLDEVGLLSIRSIVSQDRRDEAPSFYRAASYRKLFVEQFPREKVLPTPVP